MQYMSTYHTILGILFITTTRMKTNIINNGLAYAWIKIYVRKKPFHFFVRNRREV